MRSKLLPILVVLATLLATSVAFAGAPVHRVSGGGSAYFEDYGLEYYAFTATIDAAGVVSGQAELHFLVPEGNFHAEMNCLAVDGNKAWLGMVITRSDVPESIPVGLDFTWQIQDNGEGNNADPDLESFFLPTWLLPYIFPDATSCFDMPDFFQVFGTYEWVSGNIDIH